MSSDLLALFLFVGLLAANAFFVGSGLAHTKGCYS
jgi:hypothetical protein